MHSAVVKISILLFVIINVAICIICSSDVIITISYYCDNIKFRYYWNSKCYAIYKVPQRK